MRTGEYLPQPNKGNSNLPGMGGVFNYINLDGYQYAGQNPVKLIDPDGRNVYIYGNKKQIDKIIEALEYASGTKLQVKRINGYKVRVNGFESKDDRFSDQQGRLKKLIDSNKNYKIRFDTDDKAGTGALGGGCYDDDYRTAYLNMSHLNDKKQFMYDSAYSEERTDPIDIFMVKIGIFTPKKTQYKKLYMEAWDTVAHEFLAHAYDHEIGILKKISRDDAESRAQQFTNTVRILRKKGLRNR